MTDHATRTVLITGAGKRVGAATALCFAKHGDDIILHYRQSREEAEAVKQRIEAAHPSVRVELASGDLSRREDVEKIFENISPDVVINNAASFKPAQGTDLTSEEAALELNFATNVSAPLLVALAAKNRLLKEKKRGLIVFIGDAFIEHDGAYAGNLAGYTASKAALPALTRNLAKTYGTRGIRFLCAAYGPVEPPPGARPATVQAMASDISLPASDLNEWLGAEAIAEDLYLYTRMQIANGCTLDLDGGRLWLAPSEHD